MFKNRLANEEKSCSEKSKNFEEDESVKLILVLLTILDWLVKNRKFL